MPIVTYYTGSQTASGRPCGGSNIAAPRRYAFGERIVFTSRTGRRVVGVVADRGPVITGERFDLPPAMFAKLAGKGWRKMGVVRVKARRVGRKRGR